MYTGLIASAGMAVEVIKDCCIDIPGQIITCIQDIFHGVVLNCSVT